MIPVEFHRGLHLPELDLWLDPWDARERAFVSHAHADHFARHRRALVSEATAALVRARYRVAESRLEPLRYHQPLERDGHRLVLLPAGHIHGSAMIHVTRLADGASLLYSGDFKMRPGRTAEPIAPRQADQLILETTFGLPQYAFPPQREIEAAVLAFVEHAFHDDEVPVLLGYSLGKAQEALALLHEHGIPTRVHPKVAEMTAACRASGVESLPEPVEFDGEMPPGTALIAPPNAVRSKGLRTIRRRRVAMLSGWALTPGASYRYRVDEAIPLSDHADHPGLLEFVRRVAPRRVLTVHGYAREFAAELRQLGIEAWSAAGRDQLELALATGSSGQPGATRHPRPAGELANFTDLCRRVGETRSRLEKIERLADYLRGLDASLPLAAGWLGGRALPRRLGSLRGGGATLRRALLMLPGAREERYRAISLSQNDAARCARLVLEELPLEPEAMSLAELREFFLQLARQGASLARVETLAERLRRLHPREGETLVALFTGDLRIGLKEGLVEEAIAAAFDAEPAAVQRAHMLTGDLGECAELARAGRLEQASLHPLVPIKVMLASPEEDAAGILRRHGRDDAPLWLEAKHDGIRAQLHKRGEEVALFSRDLRPLDREFPELLESARQLPGDLILDGEIIAHAEGRRLNFFDLQKRLGRLRHQAELFAGGTGLPPVRFIAFDLLHADGETLLEAPLAQRREALEARLPDGADGAAIVRIDLARADTAAELDAAFKRARGEGHEGLISKDPDSAYSPGRRGKAWLKLKGVMPTLDCVVVAAEQGHGKRAEVLSDYTFAVRDERSGELRVIGKAYTGLTDLEIEELTDHFQRHTLEKRRRKHRVEPNLVLEIAFDSIQPSKRHDSGLALRFPRIKAIRRDKSPGEIDTLDYARSLLAT